MKRLTEYYSKQDSYITTCSEVCCEQCSEYIPNELCSMQKKIYQKLGEYEDTGLTPEEIKQLHKLTQIEVGQTVYVLTRYGCNDLEIIECRVNRKTIISCYTFSVTGRYANGNCYKGTFRESSVGKTIFLTRDEAEKVLKEMD